MMLLDRGIVLEQPRTIHFGAHILPEVGRIAAAHAIRRTLVIASAANRGRVDALDLPGEVAIFDRVDREPDLAMLAAARALAAAFDPQLVIGFGGGSAMDLAKLVAVLAGHAIPVQAIVGAGKAPRRRAMLVQVPTTAGTGSEAGSRALVTDEANGAKLAVESPHMIADAAVIDPALAVTVPAAITAETGIDALAHCVEAFTNVRAHPVIDLYAREGIRLVGRYLPRAVEQGDDLEARAGMALAALYGGFCLGPVNTAGGHAVAYPLSTQHGIGHGRANAIIFPHMLAFNAPAAGDRTAEIARLLGLAQPAAEQAIGPAARGFCARLGIPMRLTAHGIGPEHVAAMAAEAAGIRRLLDNNPRPITGADIAGIYTAAL
ncbi:iron-containing alcohol dehydrogenase (plasmid) [Croceibacterium sp. TMG7-5b_MA50]|uniref:iron-containing alcohol dehydrogenase n=1 Tax=Croceibacterium sp. TMG7-5b_MA50 TaxID=3121290 RepID=UPI003221985E